MNTRTYKGNEHRKKKKRKTNKEVNQIKGRQNL
jgi:hypothetical protein